MSACGRYSEKLQFRSGIMEVPRSLLPKNGIGSDRARRAAQGERIAVTLIRGNGALPESTISSRCHTSRHDVIGAVGGVISPLLLLRTMSSHMLERLRPERLKLLLFFFNPLLPPGK